VLGWSKRCKLARAFLWERRYKRLKLAQLLGQLGVFLTRASFVPDSLPPLSFICISGVLPEKARLDAAGAIKVNLRETCTLLSIERPAACRRSGPSCSSGSTRPPGPTRWSAAPPPPSGDLSNTLTIDSMCTASWSVPGGLSQTFMCTAPFYSGLMVHSHEVSFLFGSAGSCRPRAYGQ
jgi:hypothetical protein